MNAKAFVLLLATVLVLGAGLGGAFAGGLALGKSQDDEEIQLPAHRRRHRKPPGTRGPRDRRISPI